MRSRAGKNDCAGYHDDSFSLFADLAVVVLQVRGAGPRESVVETSGTDFTAATEWAGSVIEYAELHGFFVLTAMVAIPVIVALYARSLASLVETFILVCLVLFAAQQGELVLAVVLCGAALLAAINGFRRRQGDRMRLETRMEIRDLARKIDVFLDGLDRRSHQIDLSLAAVASSRELRTETDVRQDLPARLPNGIGEASPEPVQRK
jgi:hypothetical protein